MPACRAEDTGASPVGGVYHERMKNAGPPFKILSVCKGGGYRYCRTDPPHPHRNSNGLYPLHRVLLENKLGRLLKRWGVEVAHHNDEDKTNDDPNNIVLKTSSTHSKEHADERAPEPISDMCAECGRTFAMKSHVHRQRKARNKTGKVFCSHKCATRTGKNVTVTAKCSWCSKEVVRPAKNVRPGQVDFVCNKSCQARLMWSRKNKAR